MKQAQATDKAANLRTENVTMFCVVRAVAHVADEYGAMVE
jgi:hypothetical protein